MSVSFAAPDDTGRDAGVPPLVSVITIFLNGARFLAEAIESVIAQTFADWELLLVDDGSTDGASDIARDYASRYPTRIRYLHHDRHRNHGMSASRNLGLGEARGALVAFLDGDDAWLPEKIERQVRLLESHPDVDMACGATRVWRRWAGAPSDAEPDSVRLIQRGADAIVRAPEMLRRFLHDVALTPATCNAMIRRKAVARIGGFEERFTGLYEDQVFFLKAYLRLDCCVTSDTQDLYRQHAESHMAIASRTGRYSVDRPSAALADLYRWCARYFVRERVTDRVLWGALLGKLRGLAMHRVGVRLERLGPTIYRVRSGPARARDFVRDARHRIAEVVGRRLRTRGRRS